MLTQERLKELLDYDPGTGVFSWIVDRGGTAKAGSVAGRLNGNTYLQIMVDGKRYCAHRLAWLYVHGEFPPDQLDHINRIRTDNRISNLRPATGTENNQNCSKRSDNTSGVIGVGWHKKCGKWVAHIRLNGRRKHLGLYDTIEEAAAARASAKAELHTFHPEDNNVSLTEEAPDHWNNNRRD